MFLWEDPSNLPHSKENTLRHRCQFNVYTTLVHSHSTSVCAQLEDAHYSSHQDNYSIMRLLPSYSVDVCHSDDLKEGDDEERYRAHVTVKDLQPVVPRTHSEYQSHQERYEADQRCREKKQTRGGKKEKVGRDGENPYGVKIIPKRTVIYHTLARGKPGLQSVLHYSISKHSKIWSFPFWLLPVKSSLGIHLGTSLRSWRGVRTPSRLPNMEDRPRLNSMMKKSTAHTWSIKQESHQQQPTHLVNQTGIKS